MLVTNLIDDITGNQISLKYNYINITNEFLYYNLVGL